MVLLEVAAATDMGLGPRLRSLNVHRQNSSLENSSVNVIDRHRIMELGVASVSPVRPRDELGAGSAVTTGSLLDLASISSKPGRTGARSSEQNSQSIKRNFDKLTACSSHPNSTMSRSTSNDLTRAASALAAPY